MVIAAGGTAGHVVPALAVADALSERGATVSFAGTAERAEAELVPAAGYEIDFLPVRGIDRGNPLKAAGAVARAGAALPMARRLLKRRGANAVMGGGGYVAGPAGAAALAMRLPLVLTEADSHLGLTNRILAPRARRVCLAFPIAGCEGDRFRVTGRPVPSALTKGDRSTARRRFGIEPDALCLLVFGGSLGARSINEVVQAAFVDPAGPGHDHDFHILHISGRRDHPEAESRLIRAGDGAGRRYTLVDFEPGLADALAAADLVLARSGGSVFELTATGKPAILVPYPYATADHQRANAEWMADVGAAVIIDDAALEPDGVTRLVAEIFGDRQRLEQMAAASLSLAKPSAAADIADELLAAVGADPAGSYSNG